MADNDGYTVKQMLMDSLEVSGQGSLSNMYARAKELERYSLGLLPVGGYRKELDVKNDDFQRHISRGMQAINRNSEIYSEIMRGAATMSQQEIQDRMRRDADRMMNASGNRPLNFAATAAHKKWTAKTPRERKVADLMEFVARYRDGCHVVTFPGWLSKTGRERLLEIAKRRA